MSFASTSSGRRRAPKWAAVLVVADAVLLFLPPFHWAAGANGPVASIGYFVGSALAVMASLFVMVHFEERTGEI